MGSLSLLGREDGRVGALVDRFFGRERFAGS